MWACKSPCYSGIGLKPAGDKLFFPLNSMAAWGRKTSRADRCRADGYAELGDELKERERLVTAGARRPDTPVPVRNIERRGDILTKKLFKIAEFIL